MENGRMPHYQLTKDVRYRMAVHTQDGQVPPICGLPDMGSDVIIEAKQNRHYTLDPKTDKFIPAEVPGSD